MFDKLYHETVEILEEFFSTNKPLNIPKLEENISFFLKLSKENNYSLKDLISQLETVYSTASHCVNVTLYSIMLAMSEGYNEKQLVEISLAALLHDIGKINISQEILNKPSHLSDSEFEAVHEHPLHSERLAKELGITDITILAAIRSHHENYDGSGYPNGIKGKAIPRMAQIIGLCDAFDALTSKRDFRSEYSTFEALTLIKDEMSDHFEEKLRNDFIRLF